MSKFSAFIFGVIVGTLISSTAFILGVSYVVTKTIDNSVQQKIETEPSSTPLTEAYLGSDNKSPAAKARV